MTLPVAHLDVETRSTCDLKTAGLYRYFEDPTTEVLVVRWRIGDGPVRVAGALGQNEQLISHIRSGGTVTGHNIAFDRECWNRLVAPGRNWPQIAIEQTDCTMARCNALAVPAGLEQAGKALGLKITKDVEGHRLMMRMCKPKSRDVACPYCDGSGWDEKAPTDHDIGSYECSDCRGTGRVNEWHETPEQLARLSEYCATDVLSECEIDRVVPKLSPAERRVWILDQQINARGVQIDIEMVNKALAVAELAQLLASDQIRELTGGAVERVTQAARLIAWLNERGILATSMAKGEVEDLLIRTDLWDDALARRVIELRRAAAKSSVAKYRAMERSVCADGRVRGTLAYHGAGTGRWAGRLIQPQNLPRILDKADDVLMLHDILNQTQDPEDAFSLCRTVWDNPLEILSRALRSMIVAAPGKKLVGGDYANIEGRVNAWLAGETWKVEAFYAFDNEGGEDLYKLAYAKAFGITTAEVTKDQRQIGKVMELSMGYQGGVRAFQKMGANYGISVTDERAEELKVGWRDAHPAIKASWYDLQDAAIAAVKNPGLKVPCCGGRIQYLSARGVLWCRLPSGRLISYVSPRIVKQVFKNVETGVEETSDRDAVGFMGVESTTKQWKLQRLYGGMQCENVVQAIARDILVEGMFRLEAAGYPLVLTVHDENICEVPDDFGSPEELAELMSIVPAWAEGLPVAVSPWEDQKYVK